MSQSPKRRRIILPTLLATGLSVAAGGGGYILYAPESIELNPAAQEDLDAGFESAQANDTLGAMASAWSREAAGSVTQAAAEEPLSAVPDLADLPELPAGDRYASMTDDSAPAAELPPLPPVEDRYAAVDDQIKVPAKNSTLEDEDVADQPHSAAEVLARGQSPDASFAASNSLPDSNPLRAATPLGADSGLPDTNPQAEAAFAAAAPMPMAEMPIAETPAARSLQASLPSGPPEPTEAPAPNPLRAATRPAAEAAPTPFAAAASETAPYGRQFESVPIDSAPIDTMEPEASSELANNQRTDAFAQPPRNAYAPRELAPIESATPVEGANRRNRSLASPSPSIDEGTGRPGERALEGPQRPSLVLQKFAPEEIQVGKECKFVVKVRNVGQRPAENVVVEDQVPQGTRLVTASPQPETSGTTLAWQLGTLSPGEERTMEVELMPTEEGEIGSVAQVTFASHASAKSRCTRPQLALRLSAPSEVMIGRQQRLTIEIHNPGTGDATGVMLLENVPENVRHQAGPALEFEIGTLRAGETRRMELVLTAEKPGRVVNLLTARADGNLQVQQEVEFEVISPALAVAVEGPSRRYLERPATYTVNVNNPGTATAKDVQLVTKLPKGMQFVRANNLGEYDSATHSVYWSLAELPEGQHGSVELVALPVQSGDHTIEVEGRAREGLEDRTTQAVRIEGLAAIMFTVSDAQDPIEVGGTTSYEIRVVNQGSKAASNVQVRALVPQGMAVTNVQGETRHAVEAEGVVFEPIGRLAPKADAVFQIDLQGVRPGDQRIMVEVLTDEIEQPIRKEESTRVFGDE